ncbi:MAG: hypothetical protein ACOC71_06325 [Hyphomicrobiales bacterium]
MNGLRPSRRAASMICPWPTAMTVCGVWSPAAASSMCCAALLISRRSTLLPLMTRRPCHSSHRSTISVLCVA